MYPHGQVENVCSVSPADNFFLGYSKRKRRRSDPVLWQNPLYQQKIRKPKDNTQTPPKTSITQRLRTDLGRSVGVTSHPRNRPILSPLTTRWIYGGQILTWVLTSGRGFFFVINVLWSSYVSKTVTTAIAHVLLVVDISFIFLKITLSQINSVLAGKNKVNKRNKFTILVFSTPWGRRGLKSRIRPPYPQRVVKGD